MNRRDLFAGVVGLAVSTAVPRVPFIEPEWDVTAIVSETLRSRGPEIARAVFASNALLSRLRSLDGRRIETWAGPMVVRGYADP